MIGWLIKIEIRIRRRYSDIKVKQQRIYKKKKKKNYNQLKNYQADQREISHQNPYDVSNKSNYFRILLKLSGESLQVVIIKKEKIINQICLLCRILKARGKNNCKELQMEQTNKILYRINKLRKSDEEYTSMEVERERERDQEEGSNHSQNITKQNDNGNLLMLPSNLFNFVCMFLKASEIVNLTCSSRLLREKVLTQAQYALSTIALKFYFGSEIDSYVDYGDEERYLACKSQRNNVIADYMKHKVVDQLTKISQLRSQIQQTPQVALLDLIFTDILNPPMPIMKIRRENVGMHAHTWFQNKLVDVYYEQQVKSSKTINQFNFANSALKKIGNVGAGVCNGNFASNQFAASTSNSLGGSNSSSSISSNTQKSFGFFTNHFGSSSKKLKCFSQTISDIQQKQIRQKQIQQQNGIQPQQILNNFQGTIQEQYISPQKVEQLLDSIRWYRDFDEIQLITDQTQPDIQRYIQENQVVLTVLLVSTIFKNQCQFFYEYLEQNSNHATYFDLISEYNLKWNIYQAAVIETQENLEEVYKTFNDLYQVDVGVKMYPQYSVLRVAAQHWARFIMKPLKEKLFNAFFNLLENRRIENLNYVITQDQTKIDPKLISVYYMPEKLEISSADLIQRYQRISLQYSQICGSTANSNSQLNTTISNNSNLNDKMYQEFFSKNSYYVDNMLYTFCENMMDLSVNEASVHWLGHTDLQVGHIYADLHSQFLERTSVYLQNLYNQVFQGFVIEWKQFLMGELKYCRKIVKESTFKQTNKLVLEHFFKAYLQDIEGKFAQTANQVQVQSHNDEDQSIKQKLIQKGLSQNTINFLSDPRSRRLLDPFLAMKEEEEEFNSKSVRDEDIEDINRYRQIKQKLDDEAFSFYDLIGNVDHSLIEKNKNLIRQKLQKQNENSQNIQKQNNHQNSHNHSNTQLNHQNHGSNHQYNSHGHHAHHHHLNTNYPTHFNGSHFLALQNANNNHFHHHFQQQIQQNFQLINTQQQQQIQNQYSQQIDDLLLFSQNILNNNNYNNNSINN